MRAILPILLTHTDETVRGGGEVMVERVARLVRPFGPLELALVHGAKANGNLSGSGAFRRVHSLDFPRRLRPATAGAAVWEVGRYRSLLKGYRACVSFSWEATMRTVVASLALPLPLLWFCQREPIIGDRVWRAKADWVFAALRRKHAIVVAPSEAVRGDLLRLGHPPPLTPLIRNGIDVEATQRHRLGPERRAAFRTERGLPLDAILVCCPARLDPSKDQLTLLRALRLALERDRRLFLLCLGEATHPTYRRELEAETKRLGIEPRVAFVGHQPEVLSWLAASDVVVLPSRTDAAPLVLLEAAALGLPIVATSVGGTPELVVDGKSGYLFAPGDVSSCAEILTRLAADPFTRKRLGQGALTHCRHGFDAATTEAEWKNVLVTLLGPPSTNDNVRLRP